MHRPDQRCGSHHGISWVLATLLVAVPAEAGREAALPEVDAIKQAVAAWVPDVRAQVGIHRYLDKQVRAAGTDRQVRVFLLRNIRDNMDAKRKQELPGQRGFPLTVEELQSTVIDYEIFKYKTLVSSGVFPKRYFGYLDLKWDTAERERMLREVVHQSVALANRHAEKHGLSVRCTDAEVAVTFIAEGGALLMQQPDVDMGPIHPVKAVGLNDLAQGLQAHKELAQSLDQELGTGLLDLVGEDGKTRQSMDFKEAVAGTALMYLWEKERAAGLMVQNRQRPMPQRTLDEQFVVTSLVYNSGTLFSEERVQMIRNFRTAHYLHQISLENKATRGLLGVLSPPETVPRLLMDGYPEQPTSWSAVYHVLQRYGGLVALRRFTRTFDSHGMFVSP